MADIFDRDVRKKWAATYGDTSAPTSTHDVQPSDHFKTDSMGKPIQGQSNFVGNLKDKYTDENGIEHYNYLVHDKSEHFIRDLNDTQMQDPKAKERPVEVPDSNVVPESILNGDMNNAHKVVFSGSTTNVNPTNDPEKEKIIKFGLNEYEEERVKEAGDYRPPLSVMHPFTRMIDIKNRNDHQIANLTAFNRYHLPVSDLEHRKAFRHIFFTRPECYICCNNGGKVQLSQQAECDEDFNTSYSRMPYISKLLSPIYVSGTFGASGISKDNFNYLLSNRCMGLTPSGSTLSTQDTVGKSIQGYTVIPGMHYEGRQGATISVTFRDTKYLEIYEYIRMWMLYIWKIKFGIFAPSFNGYKYINGFPSVKAGSSLTVGQGDYANIHPLDRALDYTCSMFDFINDESDTFPRYWCKYYGMYPIDIQIEGLGNSNNDALKEEMSVSVTFKYAYKIENTTKSLVEFNFNAGICDCVGQPTSEGSGVLKVSEQFAYSSNAESKFLKNYVGPGAPFVGTPYVVLMSISKDIMNDTSNGTTMTPCLRFSPLTKDEKLNQRINMGIESISENANVPAQSDLSDIKAAASAARQKAADNEKAANEMTFAEYLADETAKKTAKLDKVGNVVDLVMDKGPGGTIIDLVGLSGKGKPALDLVNNGIDSGADKVDNFLQSGIDKVTDVLSFD